ncbi:hypothetical protein G9464_01855 [Halostella sp. JP-L12]|uniref:hypothetical protein n=1 Tax=Halostella TaxID=1843185 RepID=UPI000EF82C72|nr:MULTISPECIES: hypothetical protein [Halostella]NHN46345.1 hypothetical protein [Halostella sp. JP-L12]
MSGDSAETGAAPDAEADPDLDVPEWDDEYVDRLSDRLLFNYDLEKDVSERGERFSLYGRLQMESEKHFFSPLLSYAHHEAHEHLFLRRRESLSTGDLDALVQLGHDLADDWIEANEEHYGTEFTFVTVVPRVTDDVREYVDGFRDRTLLKYGYYGHYEINLAVVAPDERDVVTSEVADIEEALTTWEPIEREEPGLLGLISRRLQI